MASWLAVCSPAGPTCNVVAMIRVVPRVRIVAHERLEPGERSVVTEHRPEPGEGEAVAGALRVGRVRRDDAVESLLLQLVTEQSAADERLDVGGQVVDG